jgi:hypothetical protein
VHSSLGFHLWCRARLQASSVPGESKANRLAMFIRTKLQQFIRITMNFPLSANRQGVAQAKRLLVSYQEVRNFVLVIENSMPLGAIRAFFRAYRIANRVCRWLVWKHNKNELFQIRSAPLCHLDSIRSIEVPSVPALPAPILRSFVGRQA